LIEVWVDGAWRQYVTNVLDPVASRKVVPVAL
jgi:hypothetical protein